MQAAFKVALVAFSLSLDTFAMGVGVGVRGASRATKLRIGIAFAGAEVLMNGVGAGLGVAAGQLLGAAAGYLGFFALIGVGLYSIREGMRNVAERSTIDMTSGWGLALAALSISLDSLGVGFSILYIGAPLPIALGAIAAASVVATSLGLALGKQFGDRVKDRAELLGGVILTLTGVLFIVLKALGLE
jgi:putative Mn2+ efflux pump MntP